VSPTENKTELTTQKRSEKKYNLTSLKHISIYFDMTLFTQLKSPLSALPQPKFKNGKSYKTKQKEYG